MANCYLCSLYLPKGEGVRIECTTSTRQGKSRGFSLFSGKHYSGETKALRTLCKDCAIVQCLKKDKELWWSRLQLRLFLAFLFVWFAILTIILTFRELNNNR